MFEKYNIQHQNQTEKDVQYIERLYAQVIQLVALYVYQQVTDFKLFEFASYAALSSKVTRLMKEFAGRIEAHITKATQVHWNFSNKKYDTRAEVWGLRSKPAPHTPYTSKLKLSDRVWRNTQQLREELEMAIDVAYKKGTSAQELARQIKKYLNEPDQLFRHYRDKNGAMQLSKKAAAYHPGQGVYRSSLKNAQRLARTEINMAYRAADLERWQGLDFVIGYEIKRSRHPYPCKICDMMQGKYPKDFQWLGNHPNCRCYVVPIIQQGTEATAVEMNPKFKEWLTDNADRINDNNLPMFLWGDNKEVTNIISARKAERSILSEKQIRDAVKEGKITEDIFTKDNVYTPERIALHNKIIDDYFNQEKAFADKVYMLGGAPANGKSSLTENGILPHPKGALVIDPDKVKAMIPEYSFMVNTHDKELIRKAANFVHEESSHLGKEIRKRALNDNWATIIDGVNNGTAEKIHKNAQSIRELSGKKVRADYVSLDTELSLKLAKIRAEKTGREVPMELIIEKNKAISKEFPDIIKNKSFDELYLWDTNINGKPRLILKQIDGVLTIENEELYQRFLSKAN